MVLQGINKPHPVCMACCSLAKKYTSESMMVKKMTARTMFLALKGASIREH